MNSLTPSETALDQPEVSARLFHPRKEGAISSSAPGLDIMIPVADGVEVGSRFHMAKPEMPSILFFHGNGEIVSDYDDIGPVYNAMGIGFIAVDYRGYGRSTGMPSVSAMMKDCHVIFDFTKDWLAAHHFTGPLILMGRSLGSASALALASAYQKQCDGLIIESGFAYAAPLLRLLGINPAAIGFKEEEGFRNIDKIATFKKPTRIIHAENDHIIPFSDGQALYDASPATDKQLIQIPGANHNDIFFRGREQYFSAIQDFIV
jgi:fermentation-respiration switch protein FrsA (DUF1100 family)